VQQRLLRRTRVSSRRVRNVHDNSSVGFADTFSHREKGARCHLRRDMLASSAARL
jgi:hypothetical protein